MELVPIKVTIRLKPQAGKFVMQYPDFGKLKAVKDSGVDWCNYIDRFGGWKYDKASKMGESDAVNPDPDTQYGILLVPESFAAEADEEFDDVEMLDEDEYDDFYDNRSMFEAPEEFIDEKAVNAIRAKYGLHGGRLQALPTMDAHDVSALDPESSIPGITANPSKTAARMKKAKGITIKSLKRK